jgi:hypothetical protein
LLKPENFETMHIEDFVERLDCLEAISHDEINNICRKVFTAESVDNFESTSELVTNNLITRAKYLNEYFRRWFKKKDLKAEKEIDDRYAGLGQSFMDYYKDDS